LADCGWLGLSYTIRLRYIFLNILGATQLGGLEGKALQRTLFSAHPWRLWRHGWAEKKLLGACGPAPLVKRQLRKSYIWFVCSLYERKTKTGFPLGEKEKYRCDQAHD